MLGRLTASGVAAGDWKAQVALARPGGSLRRSSSALRFADRLLALASARINGFARPGSIDRLGDVGATLPAMKDVRQPVAWTRAVGKMCLQGDYDWSFDER